MNYKYTTADRKFDYRSSYPSRARNEHRSRSSVCGRFNRTASVSHSLFGPGVADLEESIAMDDEPAIAMLTSIFVFTSDVEFWGVDGCSVPAPDLSDELPLHSALSMITSNKLSSCRWKKKLVNKSPYQLAQIR